MNKQSTDTIYLHADYPHPMVERLNKILPSLDKSDLDRFETKLVRRYKIVFPNEEQEINNLKTMADHHLIAEFYQNIDKSEKEQIAFLTKAVQTLVPEMEEWKLLEVLESFMIIHKWKVEVYVPRKKPEGKKTKKKEEKKENKQEVKEVKEVPKPEKKIPKKKDLVKVLEEKKPEKKVIEVESTPKSITEKKEKEPVKEKVVLYEEFMNADDKKNLKLAIDGNANAQYEVGMFYANEKSQHLDYKEAESWLLKSLGQGHARAKFALAQIYDSGKIKEKNNVKQALQYYFDLAEQGYSTAQCILGIKYRFGLDVKSNIREAERWLLKASEQGDVNAQRHLADLYLYHNKSRDALPWLKNASDRGDAHCTRRLKRFIKKN